MTRIRRFLAALSLPLMTTAPAAAQEPWQGRWVFDPNNCVAELGDAPAIDVFADEIRFYESSCRLDSVAPTGVDGAWTVRATCTGEGQTWQRQLLFLLSGEHWDTLTLFEGDFTTYSRCRR